MDQILVLRITHSPLDSSTVLTDPVPLLHIFYTPLQTQHQASEYFTLHNSYGTSPTYTVQSTID